MAPRSYLGGGPTKATGPDCDKVDKIQTPLCDTHACILTMTGLLEAQDGAALYKERCASCHDSPEGRTPSIGAIKQMTRRSDLRGADERCNEIADQRIVHTGSDRPFSSTLRLPVDPIAKPAFEKSCTGNAGL